MPFYYQVKVTFNAGGRGVAQNTFSIRYGGTLAVTDAAVLTNMDTWMTRIYNTSGLRTVISTAFTLISCIVTEHTSTGQLIREVGGISPVISGTSSGDSSAGPTAMSAQANTNTPKARGGKRFPPPVDTVVVGQLLTNTALSLLASAASYWLAPGLGGINPWESGIFSTFAGGFVPFNGTGTVRNIPGTQTTRKPGRGL